MKGVEIISNYSWAAKIAIIGILHLGLFNYVLGSNFERDCREANLGNDLIYQSMVGSIQRQFHVNLPCPTILELLTSQKEPPLHLTDDAEQIQIIQNSAWNGSLIIKYTKHIDVLIVSGAEVDNLSWLQYFPKLKVLVLDSMIISDYSYLSKIPQLKDLQIIDSKVDSLHFLDGLFQLNHLELKEVDVADLSPIGTLLNLKSLNLSKPINNTPDPQVLRFFGRDIPKPDDISALSSLITLENLRLSKYLFTSLAPLMSLGNLKKLEITDNHILEDINAVRYLENLEILISNCSKGRSNLDACAIKMFQNMDSLAELPWLEWLDLQFMSQLDLKPIAKIRNLKHLFLNFVNVTNTNEINQATHLESFMCRYCSLEDLKPFAKLTHLKSLILEDCPVKDLTPLTNLPNIHNLSLFLPDLKRDLCPMEAKSRPLADYCRNF